MKKTKVESYDIEVELSKTMICGRSWREFLDAVQGFHGCTSPGMVLGGFMVDWAQELIGPGVEADAIVETTHCLPDAVQLFTPCKVGNGWMKILDWDKFALSLYNKKSLTGYRIWFDLNKAKSFPNLYNWYMRRVSKKELPLDVLIETMLIAGRSALSCHPVRVTHFYEKKIKGKTDICPGCGEAYPIVQGDRCAACRGQGYYIDARVKPFHVPQNKSIQILDYLDVNHREQMIGDIGAGMAQPRKTIPSKYFYDAHGSQLFDQICCTPEYYLTTTELSILDRYAPEIMSFFSKREGDLIELGSGSSRKIRRLLDATGPADLEKIRYVPVDISKSCIEESSKDLLDTYKDLTILGIKADFTEHLDMLPRGRKLIVFLGSTIGNLTEEQTLAFLRNVRGIMTSRDRFLLGIDMLKPVEIIERAYNDDQGITRRFNLNLLSHINRELNADFNPDHFEHLAFFNQKKERIEMHLRARHTVAVHIADLSLSVDLKEGETIRTEISKKFKRESMEGQFEEAGLSVTSWFSDSRGWFSLVELKAAGG